MAFLRRLLCCLGRRDTVGPPRHQKRLGASASTPGKPDEAPYSSRSTEAETPVGRQQHKTSDGDPAREV